MSASNCVLLCRDLHAYPFHSCIVVWLCFLVSGLDLLPQNPSLHHLLKMTHCHYNHVLCQAE